MEPLYYPNITLYNSSFHFLLHYPIGLFGFRVRLEGLEAWRGQHLQAPSTSTPLVLALKAGGLY